MASVEAVDEGWRYLGVLLDETVGHIFEFEVLKRMSRQEMDLLSSPLKIVGYKLAQPFIEDIVVYSIRFVKSLGHTSSQSTEEG